MVGSGSLVTVTRVTVDTTVGGVVLAAANADRAFLSVRVVGGGQSVFIGPNGVTAATGFPINASAIGGLDGDAYDVPNVSAELRGIVSGGTQEVAVIEWHD